MFKVLSILYIGAWLIVAAGYVGRDYLGGTYGISLLFSIAFFVGLPFILGYLTRMESEG